LIYDGSDAADFRRRRADYAPAEEIEAKPAAKLVIQPETARPFDKLRVSDGVC
jgi:hypothetical protein